MFLREIQHFNKILDRGTWSKQPPRSTVRSTDMPRFFFDIDDNGEVFRDGEGEALPDLAAAEDRARKILVQLAEDEIPYDGPRRAIAITIRSDTGLELLRASILFKTEAHTKPIAGGDPAQPTSGPKFWRNT
ncbi:MAG: hypothetical protein ABW043_02770 [Devosia sp.]|uniref:DUF6894 family protein n=1 Tax=Devosia sp. TaxID=1871048 RepID=UPI003393A79D